jgi:hypothetical protein
MMPAPSMTTMLNRWLFVRRRTIRCAPKKEQAWSAEQPAFLLQKLPEYGAELLPAYFLVDAGAGLADDAEIVFIGQNTWMQGPLAATPRTAFMDGAAILRVVKNAVMINYFHLHHRAGHAPVLFLHLLPGQTERTNHPLLIVLIQRDRGFPLTAKTAADAGKNIGQTGWTGGIHR